MDKEYAIPTTYEMDGLFSEKDIENRNKIMQQCRECSKWTMQYVDKKTKQPCINCKATNFDPTSGTSLRTYNPFNKRKPK